MPSVPYHNRPYESLPNERNVIAFDSDGLLEVMDFNRLEKSVLSAYSIN